jgi:hypothetical protein
MVRSPIYTSPYIIQPPESLLADRVDGGQQLFGWIRFVDKSIGPGSQSRMPRFRPGTQNDDSKVIPGLAQGLHQISGHQTLQSPVYEHQIRMYHLGLRQQILRICGFPDYIYPRLLAQQHPKREPYS